METSDKLPVNAYIQQVSIGVFNRLYVKESFLEEGLHVGEIVLYKTFSLFETFLYIYIYLAQVVVTCMWKLYRL